MTNMQIIRSPKGEEMVLLSRKMYEQLVRGVVDDEDARDAAIANAQIAKIKSRTVDMIPHAVVKAMTVDDLHPIRAWRNYRGLSAAALAEKTGLSRSTIAMLETRKRRGTLKVYKTIAKALGVGIDALME